MFRPSTIAFSAAVLQIADSAGASADQEMQGRAFVALNNAIRYFNGRQNWEWLMTEAAPIAVMAPFGVALTASAGQTSAQANSGHGVQIDDFFVGSGFSVGTRVSATAETSITFNRAITGFSSGSIGFTGTANRDFYDFPTDWKKPYSVRLLNTKWPLYPANRRAYDRAVYDEFVVTTPQFYDLFAGFQRNKIRLLPAPSLSDTLQLRYYRAMATASASGVSAVLDIPSDYELYPIAWAKWSFLSDKSEGRSDQAQTWLSFANEGLRTMIADQVRQPDEGIGFSQDGPWPYDQTSRRYVNWDYS